VFGIINSKTQAGGASDGDCLGGGLNGNGADPRGCAAVITLSNHYITKLRVNGTFLEDYIWKRINQITKKPGQKGLDKNLAN
jgi:hypothetical protein